MVHGYLLAIFDTPATEKEDRKNYNRLIKSLKANGFHALQRSSFLKYQHNMKEVDGIIGKFKDFKDLGSSSLIFIPLVESQYKKIQAIVGSIPDIDQEEAAEVI